MSLAPSSGRRVPDARDDLPDPAWSRLHHVVETTARRSPGAVAVDDHGELLTYAELDAHADGLAHLLRERGVVPGGRVGLLLARSWRTYVALLAVLKAGAAFVPIDPASPVDRVAYIADDAGLDLLVTTSDRAPGLPVPELCLDTVPLSPALDPPVDDVEGAGDPTCYVIYTSGSSGRPKGVEVAHSSIVNFLRVVPGVYDVRPRDRVYQGMTISFDFSIEEIWPTFAVGATLVVGPDDERRLGADLADFLDRSGVTVLYAVPTLLATIPRDLPAVRGLMVGGEACPAHLVERWARPGRRMLNTYGPTEATVTATWGELLPGRPVTIGRPLPTYTIHILDEDLREVAGDAAGEICIGGPGVARGYVGLPEKTADRFVSFRGERIYRTGDLGHRDPSGEIVYLGRADDEVKIRGHRVDLGEIDSVLLGDPAVGSAVAAMLDDELVAYVTTERPAEGLRERLHARLRERVPDYMVPGHLEVLPALPTMPSGKVDRKRLPAPTSPRLVAVSGAVVPPATAAEERVRDAWAEACGIDAAQLSVTANFFAELGGHSLLAATAVSAMRERGAATVAVRDLYENPTVRGLAAALPDATLPGATARTEPETTSPVRYGLAGTAQAGVLYLLLMLLAAPVAAVYVAEGGQVSLGVLTAIALTATAVYLATRWLLAPLGIRLLGRGVRPGRYRLWGRVHLRLWATDLLLSFTPLPVLSGSALLPGFLRRLGAQIGSEAHLGTASLSLPQLIEIGDDASVGYGAALRPWVVEEGRVVVGPVRVGARAFVGAGALLRPGAVVGTGAVLGEQALLVGEVPPGQRWSGSPAAPDTGRSDDEVAGLAALPPAQPWGAAGRLGTLAGLALLDLLPILMLVPTLLLVWGALLEFGQTVGLLAAACVGPVFVATACLTIAATRQAVLPATPTGTHPARSTLGVRKWVADKLLEMSLELTNSLYATLYTVPWLRALGARVGPGAEVSTVAHVDPDLLTLGRESFVADMASAGGATFHRGWVSFRTTEVGDRAFVGNAALLPPGSRLGAGSLVGVQTVPPPGGVPADTAWLGSPAMHLPARQDSGDFAERLTFRPSRRRVAERLAIEFLRICLPSSVIAVAVYLYLLALSTVAAVGAPLGAAVLVAPLLAVLFGVLVTGAVAAVKWLVVGTYRPRVEPLWSRFVRRSEFVTGLYEAAAVPAMLQLFRGTPLLPPALRLLGARIGRRTHLATTYLTEFDLVDIGDDAAVGRDASLQTHLFEDRVMKMSTVRIGAGATVGDRAVVLYDATVGEGAALAPLSLVMKGESLPAHTRWRGIPAEGVVEEPAAQPLTEPVTEPLTEPVTEAVPEPVTEPLRHVGPALPRHRRARHRRGSRRDLAA
ncbi:amino acid adenylation domain-containing protein [Pseudonocardia kujensis]|uniref:Pls/PosA family non-ribosomal peptide synthetase n=1 Tax=Pseudonocardia kujensis TaxID=1128675 RepID=UPI001E5B1B6D|nr:Pls/PosA family non-ribosomal peptide synthetase [Pseudonocardia kujensis]MCE0761492.1 amino acid adenylation domain-containing protein [Pseudonocardia kujensis]